MQMRSGDATGRANRTEKIAGLDLLALSDPNFAQVTIHRDKPLSVIEKDGIAIEKVVTRSSNGSGARRDDGLSAAC